MAIYAIGDVHGCYRELRQLLAVVPIDWDSDRLWMVGDLVNRGPASLRVLRWARKTSKRMGKRFQTVLGNHDLRLLAMAHGWVRPRSTDSARAVLTAPDRERLVRWLAKQPLLYQYEGYLLVHAGLWPGWTAERATRWARRLEPILLKGKRKARALLDPKGLAGRARTPMPKHARALEAFTSLRTCKGDGTSCAYSGVPAGIPAGCWPWFEVPGRKSADVTVVCGHWAALGLRIQKGLFALDTACIWGGSLTAVRLDDGAVFSQRAL